MAYKSSRVWGGSEVKQEKSIELGFGPYLWVFIVNLNSGKKSTWSSYSTETSHPPSPFSFGQQVMFNGIWSSSCVWSRHFRTPTSWSKKQRLKSRKSGERTYWLGTACRDFWGRRPNPRWRRFCWLADESATWRGRRLFRVWLELSPVLRLKNKS